jgi:hypothetical protein
MSFRARRQETVYDEASNAQYYCTSENIREVQDMAQRCDAETDYFELFLFRRRLDVPLMQQRST